MRRGRSKLACQGEETVMWFLMTCLVLMDSIRVIVLEGETPDTSDTRTHTDT